MGSNPIISIFEGMLKNSVSSFFIDFMRVPGFYACGIVSTFVEDFTPFWRANCHENCHEIDTKKERFFAALPLFPRSVYALSRKTFCGIIIRNPHSDSK